MSVLEFRGAAASPLAGNTLATDENFLTIENGAGSGRIVYVQVVWSKQEREQTYFTPMRLYKCSEMPSGGNVVSKVAAGGGGSSAAEVVVRASRVADNGTVTAITTSGDQEAWSVWPPRVAGATMLHCASEMPGSPIGRFMELLEGEALCLRHIFSTSPNGVTNSNTRESGMVYWEEYSSGVPEPVPIVYSYKPLLARR